MIFSRVCEPLGRCKVFRSCQWHFLHPPVSTEHSRRLLGASFLQITIKIRIFSVFYRDKRRFFLFRGDRIYFNPNRLLLHAYIPREKISLGQHRSFAPTYIFPPTCTADVFREIFQIVHSFVSLVTIRAFEPV